MSEGPSPDPAETLTRFLDGDIYTVREHRLLNRWIAPLFDPLSMILDVREPRHGPIHLGSGRRPKKCAPPKPTGKRAKVKAGRKANHKRRARALTDPRP